MKKFVLVPEESVKPWFLTNYFLPRTTSSRAKGYFLIFKFFRFLSVDYHPNKAKPFAL